MAEKLESIIGTAKTQKEAKKQVVEALPYAEGSKEYAVQPKFLPTKIEGGNYVVVGVYRLANPAQSGVKKAGPGSYTSALEKRMRD